MIVFEGNGGAEIVSIGWWGIEFVLKRSRIHQMMMAGSKGPTRFGDFSRQKPLETFEITAERTKYRCVCMDEDGYILSG